MKQKYKSKRIVGKEKLAQYRKTIHEKQKWDNELPQWIGEIEFRDYDELGYWEKRGYSNTAEPWLNDRYS